MKKNNFLPLLLIGGGAAAAALLYGVGTKQNKEDLSVVDGLGTVGSGDFLASSGVSKGYDSVDLGIEDFANNRATADAFALPSDGMNPERVLDDSGEWGFMEGLVMSAGTLAATTGAVAGVRYMNKKAGSAPAAQGVAPATQGGKSMVSTGAKTGGNLLKSVSPALKKIPLVGVVIAGVSAIDTLVNGVDERKQNTLGTEQWVDNTHMAIMPYGTSIQNPLTTDDMAKENVGNMVTDNQLAHATGLSAGKYPVTVASKEEAALVNKAVGLSPTSDVLKVSGSGFTSYVPEKGKQVVFSSGGTLKQAVDAINKAKRS